MNRSCGALAVHGFYALINWGARQKIPEDAGDFRLLSPRAAAALKQLPERNRFFKGLATWIGFRQIRVDYEPAARAHGVTTFSPGRLIGLSIEGLTSFSVAPLRFASLLGVRAGDGRVPVRPLDPLGNLDHRQIGPRLSLAGDRPDDDRRRAADHDRHRRRIYRQDPVRAEGAADLFRRRAFREARRWRDAAAERHASGPPPNERCRAAPDLAVRRRLRPERGRQPRHSRPDRARPSQRHLGDGGGRGDRPRRGRGVAGGRRQKPALRDRPARDADGAVPAADDAFPPDRWRHVPGRFQNCCARACCGGSMPR